MGRIGVVLGGGGLVGQAYHAGVLATLADEIGWDAGEAEVIVGTSAGSLTGTLLRLGASAQDLACYLTEEPLSPDGQALFDALGPQELDFPPFALRDLVARAWRAPTARLLGRTLRRPWAFRPSVTAMTMLPAGDVDLLAHASVLDAHGDDWPDGLHLCVTRRDDGGRVVFGRGDAPRPPLGSAVAASCAIPGYFAPVEIDGVEYFDGGVHSPTNADVLTKAGLDLVIVVSPMSAAHGRDTSVTAAWRLAAHRRLGRELQRLRRAGTGVMAFEPDRVTRAAMGLNPMAEDRAPEVIAAARREVRNRLDAPRLERRLALLRDGGPANADAA